MIRRCASTLTFAIIALAAPRPAAAEVSPFLTFSARLATTAGVPVDGPQQLRFRIYTAAEGGNELWTEDATIEVQDGFAYHPLGASTAFPVDLFRSPSLYLEVRIGSEVFSPRLGLTSVPFAMHAADALTADEAQHAVDADHATSADDSLKLGGVGPAAWQRATSAACTGGSFVSSINPTGTAVCTAAAVSSGDISAVTTAAGSGLVGGAASGDVSLAVDPAQFQRRVTASCQPGESIQSISASGTVTCEVDTDTAAGRVFYSGCAWVTQTGSGQSVQANCPAGKVAVSGGCYGGNNNSQYLRRSNPAGGFAGWFCGFNVGDPDSTAYANCCNHY